MLAESHGIIAEAFPKTCAGEGTSRSYRDQARSPELARSIHCHVVEKECGRVRRRSILIVLRYQCFHALCPDNPGARPDLGASSRSVWQACSTSCSRSLSWCASSIVEKVGRRPLARPLAIFGRFGCAEVYTIIAVLSGLYSKDWKSHQAAGWPSAAMALVFILIYGAPYSPLGWALPSEVHSTANRSKGVALASYAIWLCDFVVGISVSSMMQVNTKIV